MTIPEGTNDEARTTPPTSAWHLQPAGDSCYRPEGFRVLFIESYASGSHLRVARLLQEYSRHRIDILRLARDHWRALALTGHRAIADAFHTLDGPRHDLLIFSGPADIRLARAAVPTAWGRMPIAAYFHESQWTYPAAALDRIPHLVNHLETLEVCDALWFNSRFHRRTFFSTAWDHSAWRVRALARDVLPAHWHKTGVLHPPVKVGHPPTYRDATLSIAWAARWEEEKRPERLLEIMRELLAMGLKPKLQILGSARERWSADPRFDSALQALVDPLSGYLPRDAYESALARSAFWLSTAEHEFFGVAAIEAAMLGATPVVPAALAYPETLPSAVSYPAGDARAAAERIAIMHRAGKRGIGPWQIDAERFQARAAVRRFDAAIEGLILST